MFSMLGNYNYRYNCRRRTSTSRSPGAIISESKQTRFFNAQHVHMVETESQSYTRIFQLSCNSEVFQYLKYFAAHH